MTLHEHYNTSNARFGLSLFTFFTFKSFVFRLQYVYRHVGTWFNINGLKESSEKNVYRRAVIYYLGG
jgi:hypothetical protein